MRDSLRLPRRTSTRTNGRTHAQHPHLPNKNWSPYFNFVIQLFDVRYGHPDAPVGGGAAETGGLFGAVDPGAFVDRHPAGLDRVFRSGWDRRAGEVPRPVGLRHMPGRVFFHRLDRVQPFRRFQPFLADRDGVGAGEFEVLPETKGEVRAVEGEVGREARRDFLGGDLRGGLVDVGAHGAGTLADDRFAQLVREADIAQLAPGSRGHDFERVGAGTDRGA